MAEALEAAARAGVAVQSARPEADRVVLGVPSWDVARALAGLRGALGAARAVAGDESLPRRVASLLKAAGATLALAESCTGGLVAKLLTDLPGASAFLVGGIVAYANEAKVRLLGVPPEMLASEGAVCAAVVEAMALGAARAFGARYAAAVSGVAGPDGGTAQKPVGTVWVAVSGPKEQPGERPDCRRFLFAGDRQQIRESAAAAALLMVAERVGEAWERVDRDRRSK